MAEREDFSKTEIAAMPESGVPVFSFSSQEEGKGLAPEHFDIQGNKFTGFYDPAHRLIFVLDETLTENTPNALLTIGSREDRKWDDILANDYGMDLEDIRPKKNNKYQKLDIDYDGVSVYNRLITDYKAGNDIEEAMAELDYFRAGVGKKLAAKRLTAAEREIDTANTTIEKTDESIEKLRAQIKSLKSKLAHSKSTIGKKPTKESAAKILKIQSQTDKADEKLKRAQLRLRRARKRREDAERDADAARKVLNSAAPVYEIKPREPVMADYEKEEPKPLFNQDPEIMDEKIAFRPVEFEATPSFEAFAATPEQSVPAPEHHIEPVVNTVSPTSEAMPAPVMSAPQPQPYQQPQPVMQPAMPMMRPMGSGGMGPETMISNASAGDKKPASVYYIMLIILIGLSILTLWLYQNRMDNTATPNLAATEQTAPELAPIVEESAPFFEEPVFVPEPEPVQYAEPIVEPEPSPFFEEEPQSFYEEPTFAEATVGEPAPLFEEPAETFFEEPVPVAMPKPITKPEYDVNGPSNYDAPNDYDTTVSYNKPEYSVDGPANYGATAGGPQLCTSGTAPDEDGCCAGEDLRWVESYNGYGCCSAEDGECYPPLK